ncbi:SusC/RagA family TonB-linked outer membrane protein [Gynurincola endophyticus]|uniref:SusC/RagA family TonB-linked outer membrane protein n=1 Tax=Gynurincola endophyticus TaxID=2479004 RepID=UPI000F8EC093|nr:TonB-dependent receptor [Gynurincola endophyticus]
MQKDLNQRLLKIGFVLFVTTITSLQIHAQRITVSGKVVNEKNEALSGATISVKYTNKSTIADQLGNFSITDVALTDTLHISMAGYDPKSVVASISGNIIVQLVASSSLDEVVVVGYGTRRRSNLTGAISQINNKEITTTTHASLAQSLQGKIPGLQIRQNTGEPGDFSTSINIRGFGNPLYVIDGIPQNDNGQSFQRIDPNDIESISVVKDASAAVYGLRAANGVIIVTTKKGEKGKPTFNYQGVIGTQKPTDMPAMADRAQWAILRNEADINVSGIPYFTKEQLEAHINGETTDWYGLTMKNASTQSQNNISIRGGGETASYFLSMGYVSEQGLLKSGDLNYKKYNFRNNIEVQLHKNWKAEVNLAGRFDTKNMPSAGFYNIFNGTRTALPYAEAYANGNPEYLALQQYINPISSSISDISGYLEDKGKEFNAYGTLTFTVPYIKGLILKGRAGYMNNQSMNKTLQKSYRLYTYDPAQNDPYIGHIMNNPSKISNANFNSDAVILQSHLIYNTNYKNHQFGATVVYEQNTFLSRYSSLGREYDFYTNDQINQAGLNNQVTAGFEEQRASQSVIGRFTYDFRSRYMLEYAFRYDGSYRYHPDRRWGFFPVISAGWRISEEDFMKSIDFLSNLKLKASYGKVGEDAGEPFQYVQGFTTTGGGGYEFVNGTWLTGASSPSIVNEKLTWFTSSILNLGLELGFFNNRLNIEANVYQRDREGLLARRLVSLPNTFGGTLPDENLNSDRVKGIELGIGYNNRIGDFHYGISANFNYARTMNKYIERGDFLNNTDKWRSGNGYRWNDVIWGYTLDGQFQSYEEIANAPIQGGNFGNSQIRPGDFKYKDINGDGVIDNNDMSPLFYNGTPKMHYGLTLNGSYKGFDFNLLFQGAARYTIRFREVYAEVFAFGLNTPAYFFDRWHQADPYDPGSEWIPGKWPATRFVTNAGTNYLESEVWRKDASYLRLKSIQLGYTIPNKIIQKAGFNSIRVYFNAHNLITFADAFVKPFDPEKIEGAYSAGFSYPLTKSFNLGINLNF